MEQGRPTGKPARTEWSSEALWRKALRLQQGHLRALESEPASGARQIERARRTIQRIWDAGLPEWQARGWPSRLR